MPFKQTLIVRGLGEGRTFLQFRNLGRKTCIKILGYGVWRSQESRVPEGKELHIKAPSELPRFVPHLSPGKFIPGRLNLSFPFACV